MASSVLVFWVQPVEYRRAPEIFQLCSCQSIEFALDAIGMSGNIRIRRLSQPGSKEEHSDHWLTNILLEVNIWCF